MHQLDIPNIGPHFGTIPRDFRPALAERDYVYFNIPEGIDRRRYTVVVTPNDISDFVPGKPHVRSISMLRERVKLPDAVFDPARSKIGLIPDHESLPTYEAKLIRGGTYIIQKAKNGRNSMHVLGNDWVVN